MKWYTEVIPASARRALGSAAQQSWLKRSSWYLAGGTALALQVGHRQSVDLDFFSPKSGFSLAGVLRHLRGKQWKTTIAREGTIYGTLEGAKISFIAYPFFIPRRPFHYYGAVRVLDAADIAVMKIVAISQRGRKRDFVDLYWYCRNRESLADVLARLTAQYPSVAHNFHHIVKALAYFADAEADPMPKVFFQANWKTIKVFFRSESASIMKNILTRKK